MDSHKLFSQMIDKRIKSICPDRKTTLQVFRNTLGAAESILGGFGELQLKAMPRIINQGIFSYNRLFFF